MSGDEAAEAPKRRRTIAPPTDDEPNSDEEFVMKDDVDSPSASGSSADERPAGRNSRRRPRPRPVAKAAPVKQMSFYLNRDEHGLPTKATDDDAAQSKKRSNLRKRPMPTLKPATDIAFDRPPPPVAPADVAEAARWRPRHCVTCWAELVGVCVNQACAACCPYIEDTATGRVCVVHGRMRSTHLTDGFRGVMAIELVRDPGVAVSNFDVEREAGRSAVQPVDIQPHFNAATGVYVCMCGSEWPNQKSFSGHCGQCERWKKMQAENRAMPRRPPYAAPPPFAGADGQAALAKLYPYPEVTTPEWKAVVDDYSMFPPLSALLSRSPVRSLVLGLTPTHLRIYIERFGVRAGPTETERRRQLIVLAEARDSVGHAVMSLAQPRWICRCGRHFRIEAALARHAVLCDDWEACPSVAGVTASSIPIVDLTVLCGVRQPHREAIEVEAMRRAMMSAKANLLSFEVALLETRVATLQAMYAVPLRCALTHMDEMEANPDISGVMRLVLTRLRKRIQPLYDLITSPMTRRNTTVAQLDTCEATIRHWLQVMLRDANIRAYIINRAIAEGD
jgi:hypothetical protein